jgi:7-keto-8-aminopelargonate synthetase-like enzyme
MYFATGYLFGLIAMAGLTTEYDVALLDENAHFNLRDGALADGKPIAYFKHRDANDLARAIEEQE